MLPPEIPILQHDSGTPVARSSQFIDAEDRRCQCISKNCQCRSLAIPVETRRDMVYKVYVSIDVGFQYDWQITVHRCIISQPSGWLHSSSLGSAVARNSRDMTKVLLKGLIYIISLDGKSAVPIIEGLRDLPILFPECCHLARLIVFQYV